MARYPGCMLHLDDDGEGPPLVLLHGWPDSPRVWDGLGLEDLGLDDLNPARSWDKNSDGLRSLNSTSELNGLYSGVYEAWIINDVQSWDTSLTFFTNLVQAGLHKLATICFCNDRETK